MNPEKPQARERPPASISVALMLKVAKQPGSLVLVQSAREGWQPGWTLPGGGYDSVDLGLFDALLREVDEELGISRDRLVFNPTAFSLINPSFVVCSFGMDRARVGLVYEAEYRGPRLPKDGWPVDDERVSRARVFTRSEIVDLMKEHYGNLEKGAGSPLYHPDLTAHSLMLCLTEQRVSARRLPIYLSEFFSWALERGAALRKVPLYGNDYRWEYYHRAVAGVQNVDATLRVEGHKWGI